MIDKIIDLILVCVLFLFLILFLFLFFVFRFFFFFCSNLIKLLFVLFISVSVTPRLVLDLVALFGRDSVEAERVRFDWLAGHFLESGYLSLLNEPTVSRVFWLALHSLCPYLIVWMRFDYECYQCTFEYLVEIAGKFLLVSVSVLAYFYSKRFYCQF